MKIAFVYDRINKFGGAERVLLALHEIWPEAPVYTAFWNSSKTYWAKNFHIIPSFLNKIPFSSRIHEFLPLFTGIAFESFDFDGYDMVLSITSSDAAAIITKPHTRHICYCLTPTRYLWSGYRDYMKEPGMGLLNPLARLFLYIFASHLRRWDYLASRRPEKYIAISDTVKKRINTYYHRTAEIIYPPVDTDKFRPPGTSPKRDFYLIVSRLVPYKKIDYIVTAFNKLNEKLVIVGSGLDKERLVNLAHSNITFIDSDLTDVKLYWYYQNCLAFILPGVEDFGIAAVEAQSCGRPVISLKDGGGSETVIQGVTGELYDKPDEVYFLKALQRFSKQKYSDLKCRENALRFSKSIFKNKIKRVIDIEYRKDQVKKL